MAPADAQWISCGDYFQAIPFFTGRRVAVVAGTGELAFGRDRLDPQEREAWFQDDLAQFLPVAQRLRREAPDRPVAALVDRWAWRDLPADQKAAFEILGRAGSAILVRLR